MTSLNDIKRDLLGFKEDLEEYSEFGCDSVDLYLLSNDLGSTMDDLQDIINDLLPLLGGESDVS